MQAQVAIFCTNNDCSKAHTANELLKLRLPNQQFIYLAAEVNTLNLLTEDFHHCITGKINSNSNLDESTCYQR